MTQRRWIVPISESQPPQPYSSTVRYGHCDWTDEPPPPPPAIREGVLITIRAEDWYPRPDFDIHGDVTVRVVRIHPTRNGIVAWVRGHRPECSYGSSECTQPWCVEILVSTTALHRLADEL